MNGNKYNMSKKGFTLIELMVVIGILSIIVLVISQPLVDVTRYQRDSQTSDNMRDNLQFVINKMEKELRTSSGVIISSPGDSTLDFTNQSNINVKYKLSDGKITKNNTIDLTDSNIFKVISLKFWNDASTKLVTIVIEAESIDGKDNTIMQTSVYPLNN